MDGERKTPAGSAVVAREGRSTLPYRGAFGHNRAICMALDFSTDDDLEGLTLEEVTTGAEIRTPRLRGVQRSLSERSLTTKAY